MTNLYPLRPIQIVDVSFQLMRKRLISYLALSLLISLPIQVLVWIFQISITSSDSNSGLEGRMILVATILQFLAIGVSLAIVSNVLSVGVGKVYASSIFGHEFGFSNTGARIAIGIYHLAVQFAFAGSLILLRFGLGRVLIDSQANGVIWFLLITLLVPWTVTTLRLGFSVPVASYEGGTFAEVFKRSARLNKVHFWKLFGAYCACVFMILVLTVPSLTTVSIFISNSLIKSNIGEATLTNLIILSVISFIALVYSYILTVTYFNARIEHEGFDISVSISELERQGETRGKLLDTVTR